MKDKTSGDPPEYERFDAGPLTFERKGRFMSIRSSIDTKDKIDFSQELEKSHLEIKVEIDNAIKELLSQIKHYNSRDFIESISIENCFYDVESYSESLHNGLEAYAEYALSLALTEPFCEDLPHPTEDEIEKFSKNINLIFHKISWYYTTEYPDSSYENEFRSFQFFSIIKALVFRGDSAEVHHLDLVKGIFGPHKDFLTESFGFDITQIISYIFEIQDQVTKKLNQQRLCLWKMAELHKLFCEYSDKPENKNQFQEKLIEDFINSEENKKKLDELESIKTNLNNDIFEILPNERMPIGFIDLISTPFGSNSQFADGTKFSGWPTNTSIIDNFPVVFYKEKYYCFVPQLLFRNIIGILEQLILSTDKSYYQNKYQKRKGEYLEEKSLEYLSNLLPNAKVLGKLFYTITEDGITKNVETDGIAIYDDNLFIIEAKAGQFHSSVRHGSELKIKGGIKKIFSDAYDQALRTKKYIFKEPKPVFRYKNGKIALEIEDTSQFRNIFLVNITLENLGIFSTHLNSLRECGLIIGREWPWSVYLNDFRTISELIETPSEFLLYLKRRIRANDFPVFSATDELDFLMVFFKEGLYFEDGHLNNIDLYTPNGYTDAIDRYYHSQMGLVSSGEKPTLKISAEYRNLVRCIENTGKFGFTYVTTTLLGFDSETHQEILKRIDSMSEQVDDDGRCHDTTFLFNDKKLGLTIVIDKISECNPSEYHTYAELKKYQTRFDVWIIIDLIPKVSIVSVCRR